MGLAASLFLTAPAEAQDGYVRQDVVVTRVSTVDLARMLTEAGVTFTQSTASNGNPKFELKLEGIKVWLVTYGCDDKGLCRSYQLATGLAMTKKPAAAKINEWNRNKRYGKAHTDDEGDPHMIYDLDVEGGISVGAMKEQITTYKLLLRAFLDHVGWND